MPSAPDCDENADASRAAAATGANVAFMRTSGAVFTTPMQFGPTIRMPCAARRRDELALGRGAVGPGLGEAGRDHDEAPHPLRRALLDHLEHVPRRARRSTARSTSSGTSSTRRVRAHARRRGRPSGCTG